MAKTETRRRRIWEAFAEVEETKNADEAVKALKKRESLALKSLLQVYYDPRFSFLVPDSRPPYTPSEEYNNPNDLERDIKKLRIFLKDHGYNEMNQIRRETTFIQFLEGIDPKDAELLCDMIEGNMEAKYPRITVELINKAFPGLIPDAE